MSFPRKLYIDSRFRTAGSASHSDFTFQLPRSIELPAGTRAVVDSVQIPNVFPTVEPGRSLLYLLVTDVGTPSVEIVVPLVTGHYNAYTLTSHLQDQLNASGYGAWTVGYNESTGRLSLNVEGSGLVVRLLPRDSARPNDALEVIGADEGGLTLINGFPEILPHHIDIVGVRVLFLASPNFGAYNCLGPRGESDYIRQIMVNEGYSGYITDKLNHPAEYIDVGGAQLQSLKFKLVDGKGEVVDMKGRSIAFSIIFLD
jgi:hypothetical protein